MKIRLTSLALATLFGAALMLQGPAIQADDKAPPAPGILEPGGPSKPMPPIPPADPAPGKPSEPLRDGPPLANEEALTGLMEIQEQMHELEQRQDTLIDELAKLKAEAERSESQRRWLQERRIRETASQLHEIIIERQELVLQKVHLYARLAAGLVEFEQYLDLEITRLKQQEQSTAPRRDRLITKRLETITSIKSEVSLIRANPFALDGLRRSAARLDSASEEDDEPGEVRRRWQGSSAFSGRPDFRQRMQAANLPPPDPQTVQVRLERLERELRFLRAQSDRIEREIDILHKWVESQVNPDSPKAPAEETTKDE